MIISALFLLLMGGAVLTLRLGGDIGGSFPRPLCPEEEKRYIDRLVKGDLEARNKLIEHNLRLVAHIMNMIAYESTVFLTRKHCSQCQMNIYCRV